MKIIKYLINIKINMLRYNNINHIFQIREFTLTHTPCHSNILRHITILINIIFRQLIIITLKAIKTLYKIPQLATNIKIKTKVFIVKFCYLFLFFNLAILSSCSRDKYDNEALYNSVGFDQGSLPMSGSGQQKIAPDYFYRQGQGGAMGGAMQQGGIPAQYPPQYQPQQQYQPQPQQQYYPQTYGSAPYQVYPNAGSRFYSNPYAIPPSPYYPQYDVDQYYVPPTYSYGMEQSGAPSNRATNPR